MKPGNRKNSQVMVMVFGFAFVLIVLVFALGSGGGGTRVPGSPTGGASTPSTVDQRVVAALEQSDSKAFYAELSPAMKEVFTEQDMISGQQQSDSQKGQITNVDVLQEPQILTGSQWNNEWAEGRIRITRGTTSQEYITRYHLENGEWWLFGTIAVP
jgi:hypothetical protein